MPWYEFAACPKLRNCSRKDQGADDASSPRRHHCVPLESGWVQREIQNAAYEYQRTVDSGETVIVGVNRFTDEEPHGIPIQRSAEASEQQQIERLRAFRARRDPLRWRAALDRLAEHARSGENLMPAILEAVESNATVGEISETLRMVFGEYRESVVF